MAEIIDIAIDAQQVVPKGYSNSGQTVTVWIDVEDILYIRSISSSKCQIEFENGVNYVVQESVTSLASRANNSATSVVPVSILINSNPPKGYAAVKEDTETIYLNPSSVVEIRQDTSRIAKITVKTGKTFLSTETASNLAQSLSVYGGSGISELTGDVDAGPGTGAQSATVVGLQGNPISSTSPSLNDVLSWDGSQWTPAAQSGGGGSFGTLQQTYNAGLPLIGLNNSSGSVNITGSLTNISSFFPPLLKLQPGIGGPYFYNHSAIDIFGFNVFTPANSASLINIRGNGSTGGGGEITLRSTGDVNGRIGWIAGSGELYGSSPDASIQYHPNASALKISNESSTGKVSIVNTYSGGQRLLEVQNGSSWLGGDKNNSSIRLFQDPVAPFYGLNTYGTVYNSGSLEQSGSATFKNNIEVTGSATATLGFSGSLTRLSDGTSYIRAGSGITITSQSNGPITVGSVIWEWNGTDITQFDRATPVMNALQSGTMSFGTGSLAVNKVSTSIDITGAWASSGGAVAYRVATSEGLTLPQKFRLKLGLGAIPSGIRIGFMFYDPSTWSAANLLGGALTFYSTANVIYPLAALGSAAIAPYAPFNLSGNTPNSWCNQFPSDDGETLCEWDCIIVPGTGGSKPGVMMQGQTLSGYGTAVYTAATVTRGILIGTSPNYNASVNAVFNNASLTGLAVVVVSSAVGTYTAKITRLQILKSI